MRFNGSILDPRHLIHVWCDLACQRSNTDQACWVVGASPRPTAAAAAVAEPPPITTTTTTTATTPTTPTTSTTPATPTTSTTTPTSAYHHHQPYPCHATFAEFEPELAHNISP